MHLFVFDRGRQFYSILHDIHAHTFTLFLNIMSTSLALASVEFTTTSRDIINNGLPMDTLSNMREDFDWNSFNEQLK